MLMIVFPIRILLLTLLLSNVAFSSDNKRRSRRWLLRRSPDSHKALQESDRDTPSQVKTQLPNYVQMSIYVLEIQYDTWPQETLVTLKTYQEQSSGNGDKPLLFEATNMTSRHAHILHTIALEQDKKYQLCVNDTYGDGFEGFVSIRMNHHPKEDDRTKALELTYIDGSSFGHIKCACFPVPQLDGTSLESAFECGPHDPQETNPSPNPLDLLHGPAATCNATFDLSMNVIHGIEAEATVYRQKDNQLIETFSMPADGQVGEWLWTAAPLQCGEEYKFCAATSRTSENDSSPRQDSHHLITGITMRIDGFDFWLVKIQGSMSLRQCRCFIVPWDGSAPNQADAYNCE